MFRVVRRDDGLYQVSDGTLMYGFVHGSYADALRYCNSLQRSLAQLPDDDCYDQVFA